jgi:RNA polymerase primary sigma factor
LVRAAKRGSRPARERVVASHLGLVRSIARRYRGLGLSFDDLVQEGSLGMLAAIDQYDSRRGDFDAYARLRVRRAIRNALTDQSRLVRLPKHVVERRRALARADERLLQASNGRRPTVEELATEAAVPRAAVVEAWSAHTVGSLDQPVEDPSALDPLVSALEHERVTILRRAVSQLNRSKRSVVCRRYGLDRPEQSLGDVATDLHLSPTRTRALEREALGELRDSLERAGLEA